LMAFQLLDVDVINSFLLQRHKKCLSTVTDIKQTLSRNCCDFVMWSVSGFEVIPLMEKGTITFFSKRLTFFISLFTLLQTAFISESCFLLHTVDFFQGIS
jgi:hypothetical protein